MRAVKMYAHPQPQITFARIMKAASLVGAFVYIVHVLY